MTWKPSELEKEIEIIPGDFSARVRDAYDHESKASGADTTTVIFEITEEGKNKGLRVYDHFSKAHPVSQRRMMLLLRAVGLLEKEEVASEDLIGKELRIKVATEKFDGLPQARVKRYLAADGKMQLSKKV
ncbi:DUF669 domain-containing protein [Elusimicrobiota bacterium]